MKPLVLIPARGGSKGVPGKNIKLLGGKPLIQYTLDAAKELFNEDEIIVSTDSEEIRKTVAEYGLKVPFLRPKELATDTAGTYEVLLHALDYMESKGIYNDIIILLQPTSPLRTSIHIKEALQLYTNDLDMVVSVKETKSNPYYILKEENEDGWLVNSKQGKFARRQDCPKVWEMNGAIFIINVKSLKKKSITEFVKVKKYVMSHEDSIDIDDVLDFDFAELVLNKNL